jgi:TRAP-type C4-dicarboxylate transport system permease large subunit
MYAVCSILRVPVGEYTLESLPLLAAVSAATLLLVLAPGAVTFVPNLLFGHG